MENPIFCAYYVKTLKEHRFFSRKYDDVEYHTKLRILYYLMYLHVFYQRQCVQKPLNFL